MGADPTIFLSSATLVAGAVALVNTILDSWLDEISERSLVRALKDNSELAIQLESLRDAFESKEPDPEKVAEARQIISEATTALGKRQRRKILGTLDRGSDRSKANYISKLIFEVAGEPV
jgi:hypothetical protein